MVIPPFCYKRAVASRMTKYYIHRVVQTFLLEDKMAKILYMDQAVRVKKEPISNLVRTFVEGPPNQPTTFEEQCNRLAWLEKMLGN
jgi:hypothetical protein